MNIKNYFEINTGTGILATSDKEGKVNTAIYAKPHIMQGNNVTFIMRQRLTHNNLQENPYANYLFKLDGQGYEGIRLYLEKTNEEQDAEAISRLQSRKRSDAEDQELGPKYLVYFKVKKILMLIGDNSPGLLM